MRTSLIASLFLSLSLASGLSADTVKSPGIIILPPIVPDVVPRQHVYLVYTGTIKTDTFSSTDGESSLTKKVYLVNDLASPGNYSLLVVGDDGYGNPGYHIYTRVLSADGSSVATYDDGVADTSAPAENFLAKVIHTGYIFTIGGPIQSGRAALKFSEFGNDMLSVPLIVPLVGTTQASATVVSPIGPTSISHVYPQTEEFYATGNLYGVGFLSRQVVIPANRPAASTGGGASSAALITWPFPPPTPISPTPVTTKGYTVNAITAPYYNLIGPKEGELKSVPYFAGLTGTVSSYDYDATLPVSGQIFNALGATSDPGTINLTLNTTLSGLANVGGSYEVQTQGPIKLPLAIEIQPIAHSLTATSHFTPYEKFLYYILLSTGGSSGGHGYVPKNGSIDDAAKAP